jgi:hypothetical protein
MGPWFVADAPTPHDPPRSYEVLRRLIDRGDLVARTPIRGPSTRQLWTRAARTPGVAHHLGLCYACGARVEPNADHCAVCDADVHAYRDRQDLGLAPVVPLPGQADAEAIAVASLDAAASPPLPPPDATRATHPAAPRRARPDAPGAAARPTSPTDAAARTTASASATAASLRERLGAEPSPIGLAPPPSASDLAELAALRRRLSRARFVIISLVVALSAIAVAGGTLVLLDHTLGGVFMPTSDERVAARPPEPTVISEEPMSSDPVESIRDMSQGDDDATIDPTADASSDADAGPAATARDADPEPQAASGAARNDHLDSAPDDTGQSTVDGASATDANTSSPPSDADGAAAAGTPLDAAAESHRARIEAAVERALTDDPAELAAALDTLIAIRDEIQRDDAAHASSASPGSAAGPALPLLQLYINDVRSRLLHARLDAIIGGSPDPRTPSPRDDRGQTPDAGD